MANTLEAATDLTTAELSTIELPMISAQRHQKYRVSRVEGDSCDTHRLKALGFCEGREVQILRTGRAWIVRVLGSRVGISSQLASIVQLVPAA